MLREYVGKEADINENTLGTLPTGTPFIFEEDKRNAEYPSSWAIKDCPLYMLLEIEELETSGNNKIANVFNFDTNMVRSARIDERVIVVNAHIKISGPRS